MNLIVVEMRRALHRRVVRVLIVLALLACTAAGIIVFADSAGKTVGELQFGDDLHPALMRNWWIAGTGDGALMISLFFLLLGGSSAARRSPARNGEPARSRRCSRGSRGACAFT